MWFYNKKCNLYLWISTGQNNFDASKAFVGEITRVNVWMKRLEHSYAANMGRGCGLWNGNVVRWSELKYNLVGDVQVLPGSECFIPGELIKDLFGLGSNFLVATHAIHIM